MISRIISSGSYARQRWKNGRGFTEQIAIDDQVPPRWRISTATLTEDGPFSKFEGYNRILIVIDGPPIELSHNGGRPVRVEPLAIHRFSGAWTTELKISGPGRDLNIFVGMECQQPDVAVEHSYPVLSPIARILKPGRHFIYSVAGQFAASCDERTTLNVNTGDTLEVYVPREQASSQFLFAPSSLGAMIFIHFAVEDGQ